ncbi:MAG: hypothetical protein AAGA81_23785 [Acidobacteriota bacterium]
MPLLAILAGLVALLGLAVWLRRPTGLSSTLQATTLAYGVLLTAGSLSGIPSIDIVLAGLGGTALLCAAAALLLATPRPRDAAFFWVPFVVYAALVPWSQEARPPNGDEPWYLLMAHSLVFDGDLDLANNYAAGDSVAFAGQAIGPQVDDPQGPRGQQYSRHAPTLALLLALPYRVAGLTGAQLTLALMTALLTLSVFRLGRSLFPGSSREVAFALTVFSLAPPLLYYSHQIWTEVPAALLLTVGLLCVTKLKAGDERRVHWVWLALSLLALPLLKARFVLISIGLLAVATFELRRHRKALLLMLVSAGAGVGALALLNRALLGRALGIHRPDELMLFRESAERWICGVLGPFLDVGFGLLLCAPLWMLLVPAIPRVGRRYSIWLALICLPYLFLLAPRQEWYGGFSPPFRYGIVLLPVLALSLVPLFERRRSSSSRVMLAGLGLLTLALASLCIAVPGWTYNLADGRTLLLDHATSRFDFDVSRLFPSYTRTRLASWIWPLALLGLLTWGRGRNRPASQGMTVAVALLLTAAALAPSVAASRATGIVEVESPHVLKTGGHPEPEKWTPNRTRFAESWVLREYELLEAPIVPGGDQLHLDLKLRFIANRGGSLRLRVLDRESGSTLGEATLSDHDVWQEVGIGPIVWAGSETLRLEVTPSGGPGSMGVSNGVVIDRLRLRWK